MVKGDLESLQNKADQLGVALGKKVDKSDQEMVSKTKTTIGDMLQEGILAFS